MVVNGGTNALRVFAAEGTYLASWGSSGDGPDEFGVMAPSRFELWPGDSVMGGGAFQRRISVFDSNGNQGRTFKLGDGYECVVAVVTGDSGAKLIATTNATFGARACSCNARI